MQLIRSAISDISKFLFLILLLSQPINIAFAQSQAKSSSSPSTSAEQEFYRLGIGDDVQVSVFQEPDLSLTSQINDSGALEIPLIGSVKVSGLTLKQAQNKIARTFANGYLIDPKVTITIKQYRPFYIIGEVNKSGSFPYVIGMTILNAVALAGGLSARGDKDDIRLYRTINNKRKRYKVTMNNKVYPGDIIEVSERFF